MIVAAGELIGNMNPLIAKIVILAASAAMMGIRAPHGRRSRTTATARSFRTPREAGLLALAWIGFIAPLFWVFSSAFSFADYPLRMAPLAAGIVLLTAGLWLFYRSHADLGASWSVTLEVREHHRLVTEGVYRRIRHPMYSALFLYSAGQALAVPNWVAGPSYLVSFGILFALRIRAEERMMLETFGGEYVAYMARTKRVVPGVW